MSKRELRVPAFLLVALVGAACSSGGASSGESSTTTSTAVGDTTISSSSSSSSSTTTIPAGYATLASLLLTNVPRGLTLQPDKIADTGATNIDKAIQDAVAPNAAQVLRGAGFTAGYQRSWASADLAQHDVIFLYQFASAAGAARYATDRVSELEAANAALTIGRFAVLIAGAVGLHSESPDSSFGVVVFSKGVYAVEALSTDASKNDQSLAAAALAGAQNQRLP